MIETALVYIYSLRERDFIGCGALVEGGYIATCRHVWHYAIEESEEASESPEVEIEFPFAHGDGAAGRARLADTCEGLDDPLPHVGLLQAGAIPGSIMALQLATKEAFEVGAARAHTYLLSRKRYIVVTGKIGQEIDPQEGLRQFHNDQSSRYFFEKGSSGSPVFLENAQQLAGIVPMSELGANEGDSDLREAFAVPATMIRKFLVRLQARPVADKEGIGRFAGVDRAALGFWNDRLHDLRSPP